MKITFQYPKLQQDYQTVPNVETLRIMLNKQASKSKDAIQNTFSIMRTDNKGKQRLALVNCKYCTARLKYRARYAQASDRQKHLQHNDLKFHDQGVACYELIRWQNVHSHQSSYIEAKKRQINKEAALRYLSTMSMQHNLINIMRELEDKFNIDQRTFYVDFLPFTLLLKRYAESIDRMHTQQGFRVFQNAAVGDRNNQPYSNIPAMSIFISPLMMQLYQQYGQCCTLQLWKQQIFQDDSELIVGGIFGFDKHINKLQFALITLKNIPNDKSPRTLIELSEECYKMLLEQFFKLMGGKTPLVMMMPYNATIFQAISKLNVKGLNSTVFFDCNSVLLYYGELIRVHNRNQPYVQKSLRVSSYVEKLDKVQQVTAFLQKLIKAVNLREFDELKENLYSFTNVQNLKIIHQFVNQGHKFCFSKITCPQAVKQNYPYFSELLWGILYPKTNLKEQANELSTQFLLFDLINPILQQALDQNDEFLTNPKNSKIHNCEACNKASKMKVQSEDLLLLQIQQLNQLREMLCYKSYKLILRELGATLPILSAQLMKSNRDINGNGNKKYQVLLKSICYIVQEHQQVNGFILRCECKYSEKCGLPCSHQLYVAINHDYPLHRQINSKWIVKNHPISIQ